MNARGVGLRQAYVALLVASAIPSWTGVGWSNWQTFNASRGLGSNSISFILEDRRENLWFATHGGGVSRYDGARWRTFTTSNGLADNDVAAIMEDRAGGIWCGFGLYGEPGLSRMDQAAPDTFTSVARMAGYHVRSICEDLSGNVWIGTYEQIVWRFDGVSWQGYGTNNGLAPGAVLSILADRSGNLWFATYGGGVSRFDGSTWRTFTTADGLADNDVDWILEDRSGSLWFATEGGGVSRYDGTSWNTLTTADGLASNDVRFAFQDRSGDLWFATFGGGVSHFDGVNWRSFGTDDGLADRSVLAIHQDRSGNMWFATEGGASRYDREDWRRFTTTDGLVSNNVRTLIQDRSGNFWFGAFGGVSRYDGAAWRTVATRDSLGANDILAILEDRAGNIWVGTGYGGVSRYDGSDWRAFTTTDGLGDNTVSSMLQDSSGNLWFGTNGGGVSRYDGTAWRTFTTADGLVGNNVWSILQDRSGNLWFGTFDGVSRYDGSTWRNFTTAEGLGENYVVSMAQDSLGNFWFGTYYGGVTRYDGSTWSTFTTVDGLAGNLVAHILVDHSGNLWFGSFGGGVTRYDGASWRSFSATDGLGDPDVARILEDRSGRLWFATNAGVARYEPDRVAPRAVILSSPPPVLGTNNVSVVFAAAFGETEDIEFSYRFDGGFWSPWSALSTWSAFGLPDGHHLLEIRCRDFLSNEDSTPAVASFEVDGTPPVPAIEGPTFGQAVRGPVAIRGTAADARFMSYRVAVRAVGAASWNGPDTTILAQSTTQVDQGFLANWDTNTVRFPDGLYDLRLSVTDSLGLTGTAQATVVVDNHFPFVDETAPAKVTAASGGDLYTTNQELHLYFPPHAFDQDALVSIVAASSPLDTLPSGAIQVLPGYEIAWSAASLRKSATLEFSTGGKAPAPGALAVYWSPDGTTWQRLGGTPEEGKVSLAVRNAGRYALFAETTTPTGGTSLSTVSFTPRVFSVTNQYANDRVAIGFSLGRPAPVTVRIYNRAGRLVNEVVSGRTMGAGANLVRWDGRDRAGVYVADGIYLVTVEALGQTRKNALAVVR